MRSPNPEQKTRPNDKNTNYSELCRPSNSLRENQRKRKKRPVHGPCKRTKKAIERVDTGDTEYIWRSWNGSQRGLEVLEIGKRIDTIQITRLIK